MKIDQDSAKVNFPPPLMLLITVLTGWGLDHLYSMPIIDYSWRSHLGLAIASLGLVIILYSSWLFKKFQTDIKPWKTTSRIITVGIYSWSRNPIYLAFVVIGIGFSILLNSYWILILQIPFILFLNNWVIKKEERYLEEKFGEEYLKYKSSVRRWI